MSDIAVLLKYAAVNEVRGRLSHERVPELVKSWFATPFDGGSRNMILISSDSGVSRSLGDALIMGEGNNGRMAAWRDD